jgi:hypothetical protein
MMVRLYLTGQKSHLCHQLGLQRTSLKDDLRYSMSPKSTESTTILLRVMRRVLLKPFRTPNIRMTRIGTGIIQMPAKMAGRHTMNHKQNLKLFRSHYSTTRLCWTATPLFPEVPSTLQTSWMQNNMLLRCSEKYFQVPLNASEVAEQTAQIV